MAPDIRQNKYVEIVFGKVEPLHDKLFSILVCKGFDKAGERGVSHQYDILQSVYDEEKCKKCHEHCKHATWAGLVGVHTPVGESNGMSEIVHLTNEAQS